MKIKSFFYHEAEARVRKIQNMLVIMYEGISMNLQQIVFKYKLTNLNEEKTLLKQLNKNYEYYSSIKIAQVRISIQKV
jgi:hypothetical protein